MIKQSVAFANSADYVVWLLSELDHQFQIAMRSKVAQNTSTNSDYAAALRVRKSYLEIFFPGNINDPFSNWCEERLNPAKAPDCA